MRFLVDRTLMVGLLTVLGLSLTGCKFEAVKGEGGKKAKETTETKKKAKPAETSVDPDPLDQLAEQERRAKENAANARVKGADQANSKEKAAETSVAPIGANAPVGGRGDESAAASKGEALAEKPKREFQVEGRQTPPIKEPLPVKPSRDEEVIKEKVDGADQATEQGADPSETDEKVKTEKVKTLTYIDLINALENPAEVQAQVQAEQMRGTVVVENCADASVQSDGALTEIRPLGGTTGQTLSDLVTLTKSELQKGQALQSADLIVNNVVAVDPGNVDRYKLCENIIQAQLVLKAEVAGKSVTHRSETWIHLAKDSELNSFSFDTQKNSAVEGLELKPIVAFCRGESCSRMYVQVFGNVDGKVVNQLLGFTHRDANLGVMTAMKIQGVASVPSGQSISGEAQEMFSELLNAPVTTAEQVHRSQRSRFAVHKEASMLTVVGQGRDIEIGDNAGMKANVPELYLQLTFKGIGSMEGAEKLGIASMQTYKAIDTSVIHMSLDLLDRSNTSAVSEALLSGKPILADAEEVIEQKIKDHQDFVAKEFNGEGQVSSAKNVQISVACLELCERVAVLAKKRMELNSDGSSVWAKEYFLFEKQNSGEYSLTRFHVGKDEPIK